jgi:hypothetical protein
VRVKSVLIALLGLGTSSVVICGWKLHGSHGTGRANLVVPAAKGA